MAGGKSVRLGYDKLVAELMGIPIIVYTYGSLRHSLAQPVYAAVSNNSPSANNLLKSIGASTILTPGTSYADDVAFLSRMLGKPFLTLAADSIFLRPSHINQMINAFQGRSVAAAVKINDMIVYVGLNVVVPGDFEDRVYYFEDKTLGVSVNTTADIDKIRRIIWNGGYSSLLQ
ncbi:MAG: NTP transferase domain-containing protein [Nitrososphaerota archaeon]|jgi:GTP:adenosylcobinamide-phosphate guanylyltransferase|nr:NTP transferase domain-containing protein [Nitrososphaerota archaeon]MDG6927973.1 NTP transferase domain-containing protein [Nitrososphaerota archaeon]MDG6929642.1 NTP transferase domain-containing protein [Nitrososphaerota archaeon]MDG6932849.1 NTP transferase domain-containing protein [Nitrososphaerota archaeon]MDG6945027.1 NTP transferase domain-containing protein [Nitrososphaerota archaeon]